MKKDIEWAKKKIKEIHTLTFDSYEAAVIANNKHFQTKNSEQLALINRIMEILDQLDEPEVLSQELPAIPNFVAEWYESEGKRNSWWNWFYKWGRDESRTELETKTIRWMQDFNEELFVDMFRYGYEVEEEQKYYVIDKEDNILLIRGYGGIEKADNLKISNSGGGALKLTEQEIKDYDERFWPFAVKVEEMEG